MSAETVSLSFSTLLFLIFEGVGVLICCCEILASANIRAGELAFGLTDPQCNMALAIQQMIFVVV
ncbi:DUF6124 family protein [Pseudomonas sp. NPDC087697]|uniref:DUF6124 family protein n=1 Tax=Pseudomonas sp. NPDC087697 TaxID=3364447 RepID=UPI00383092CA